MAITYEVKDGDIRVSKDYKFIGYIVTSLANEEYRFDIAPNKDFVSLNLADIEEITRLFDIIDSL